MESILTEKNSIGKFWQNMVVQAIPEYMQFTE